MSLIILYGGTFDPPHLAHLGVMQAALQQLPDAQLRLLPCFLPVHKAHPGANAHHRQGMLAALIDSAPELSGRVSIDARELLAQAPRYTVDTLSELRAELGVQQPLAFLLGADSLYHLPSWHRWQSLTDFCHLLVYPRPGFNPEDNPEVARYFADKWIAPERLQHLADTPAGRVCLLSGTKMAVASREIRNGTVSMHSSVPQSVLKYIEQHSLYQTS